jgi:hypothetical protein
MVEKNKQAKGRVFDRIYKINRLVGKERSPNKIAKGWRGLSGNPVNPVNLV